MEETEATARAPQDDSTTSVPTYEIDTNPAETTSNIGYLLQSVFEAASVQPLGCCRAIQTCRRVRTNLEATDLQTATTTHGPEKTDSAFNEKLVMAMPLVQLILGTGDITGMKTHAILNPNNANLDEYTNISQQICDAGGRILARESQGLQQTFSVLPASAVVHTTAGDMQPNIEYVFHVVWPEIAAYNAKGAFQKILVTMFLKSLRYTSDVLQDTALAVPAQSLGVLALLLSSSPRPYTGR